jgi:hypothetical protein
MEHFTQDARNELYLNIFNQCVDPNNNYFLVGVTNEQTRVSKFVPLPNSQIISRNTRDIHMVIYTSTLGGVVGFDNLKGNSFYSIEVFEQTSSTNVDPKDASVLGSRWIGTMIIDEDSEVQFEQYPNPTSRNYVYFKD